MKEELINKAYEIAKERYAAVGVDTEKWKPCRISICHCIAGKQMM